MSLPLAASSDTARRWQVAARRADDDDAESGSRDVPLGGVVVRASSGSPRASRSHSPVAARDDARRRWAATSSSPRGLSVVGARRPAPRGPGTGRAASPRRGAGGLGSM